MGPRLELYLAVALFLSPTFAADCGGGGPQICINETCDYCTTYGRDCTCEYVRPQYCGNSQNCELIQKCIPRNQTCTYNPCPNGQRCQLDEVDCVRAPCWPARSCRPYRSCGVNEEWRDCAQSCEPSCASPAPLCPETCQPGRCQCREGYFRRNGMCVTYTPGCGGITIQGPGG